MNGLPRLELEPLVRSLLIRRKQSHVILPIVLVFSTALIYMTTRPSPTVCKIFCRPASAQRRSGLCIFFVLLSLVRLVIVSLKNDSWSNYRMKGYMRITHRFWATCRKVLDKNRLDLMASRLRSRQSNQKREIETRCHLSR